MSGHRACGQFQCLRRVAFHQCGRLLWSEPAWYISAVRVDHALVGDDIGLESICNQLFVDIGNVSHEANRASDLEFDQLTNAQSRIVDRIGNDV